MVLKRDWGAEVTPAWLNLVPASIRTRVEHRHQLLRVVSNTGWLFGDQVIRIGVGVVVGVWVARYLGPAQFGLLNYAIAFVSLFGTVASLGLNGIVVRDLVRNRTTVHITLGTAFFLQIMGGFLGFGLAMTAVQFARPNDHAVRWIVAVLSFGMVFKSSEVVKYWFDSQLQSKYVVWIENAGFLIIAAVKVTLVLSQASLFAFVWTAFAEVLLIATARLAIYTLRGGNLRAWRFDVVRAQGLLKDSWPVILSGLAIMIYMRIDQIMLGQMLGDSAVGVYSAAVKISEVWYFIPVAIAGSVLPALTAAREQDARLYFHRLQMVYDVMLMLSVSVAVLITLFGSNLIAFFYGYQYLGAGPVLALHIWTGPFVFMGVASSCWYLNENLQRLSFSRAFAGAVINILGNLVLIPKFGLQGAAIATLLSQSFTGYFSDLLHPKTRVMFWMKSTSFLLCLRRRD